MENIKNILKSDKFSKVNGYCSIAFTNLLINENGEIFGCGCQDWVKKSLGNILDCKSKDDFEKLLNNNSEFKKSIIEQNYRFCNAFKCFFLQKNTFENKISFPFVKYIDNLYLKQIYLPIDESCNLECPTCRSKKIIHKNNFQTQKIKSILKKLNDFVLPYNNDLTIRLNGIGELFASHQIMSWLLDFDFLQFKKIKFFFHSNGTLLYKHENFLKTIVNNISGFEISIDAASDEIYSSVRKGGNWENLIKGLEIIKKLQEKNNDINLTTSFVVSEKNYHEMEKFIIFSNQYNSNTVFYKLQQWNIKNENFINMNIFSPKHEKHSDFLNMLKKIKNHNFESNFLYLFND